MKDKKKFLMLWSPLAFTLLFGVIAVCFHHIACPEVIPSVYAQVTLYAMVPVIFPVFNRFNIKIPYFLVIAATVQIIISVDFGTALNMYSIMPNYDKFLHTYFGIWCAQLMYFFIHSWGGGNMFGWAKLLVTMLAVLGVAALWEISEYCISLLLGTDPQLWKPVLEDPAYHPLWDTMWDIIVAAIGVGIFYATLLADRLCGGAIYRGTLGDDKRIKNR